MAEESVNYAEYTVERKAEGENLKKRLLFVALYVVVAAVVVILIGVTQGIGAVWLTVIVPMFIALVWFTQRLVREDRKYEILNAKLRISALNASGKGKVVSDNLVSSYAVIAPMNEEYKNIWSAADVTEDWRGSSKSPDSYFALLEKDGKNTAVLFEVTNKMLKSMKFYNKATVVTDVTR